MIGCSIALAVWTTVLLLWTVRMDKNRVVDGTGSEPGQRGEGSIEEKDDVVAGEKV